MPAELEIVYVLQRLNWCPTHGYGDTAFQGLTRVAGATRLQSFTDPEAAWEECRKREETARRVVNPFRCGGPALHYQTRFDADRLHDWLLDAGIDPPAISPKGQRDWAGWWEREHDTWTDYQHSKAWEALDRIRFHEVVERPVRPTVFVVVEVGWSYNDEGYDADPEGGRPVRAFRSWERAEEHRRQREQQRRAELPYPEGYDRSGRVRRGDGPLGEFSQPDDTCTAADCEGAFFEVVEIELEAEAP